MSTHFYKDHQRNKARDIIDKFERGIRLFIEEELKNYYDENWWKDGIPQPIKERVSDQLFKKKRRKPKKIYKKIEELTFNDYISIIFNRKNWQEIFKKTFIEKFNIQFPFEQLRNLRNELFHGKKMSDKDYRKIETYVDEIFEYIPSEITLEDLTVLLKEKKEIAEAYVSHFRKNIEKVISSTKVKEELTRNKKKSLEHKVQKEEPVLKTYQISLPIVTTDKIMKVLSDEWQTIKHLIFKLKIRDMLDARFLQLKLKELERKEIIDVAVMKGRKNWKLK